MGTLDYTTAQINNKLDGAYAGIHTHGNATAQSIPTGATYTKVQNFSDNDPAANATPDATNDKITVGVSGVYRVEGSFSFKSGTNSIVSFASVFLGGVEVESLHFSRKIGVAGDVGNASLSGIIQINAGQEIDFRVRHDNGSAVNLTFTYMNLNLSRVDI